uniref:(northern house mosquito) hypothetical protein n=1 Tax=Culex pipiens TaxID=7175 RepID=A0A8D8C5N2_CULPI
MQFRSSVNCPSFTMIGTTNMQYDHDTDDKKRDDPITAIIVKNNRQISSVQCKQQTKTANISVLAKHKQTQHKIERSHPGHGSACSRLSNAAAPPLRATG